MTEVTYESQLFDIDDAILNEGFEGFKEDYLILHSLIRKYQPKTFFEIGTCAGIGTNIICNAMFGVDHPASLPNPFPVWSMDLPPQEEYKTEQYSGGDVGMACKFPFTQIRCDSLEYDYSKTPCEGYFIDGEHDNKHVFTETSEILLCTPNIIIYHDADMLGVYTGIEDAFEDVENYDLFRVTGTRIAYALRK